MLAVLEKVLAGQGELQSCPVPWRVGFLGCVFGGGGFWGAGVVRHRGPASEDGAEVEERRDRQTEGETLRDPNGTKDKSKTLMLNMIPAPKYLLLLAQSINQIL